MDWSERVLANNNNSVGIVNPAAFKELIDKLFDEESGDSSYISLPWRRMDGMLGCGLKPGEVTVLAGLAGYGKSYMAMSICLKAHQDGLRWIYHPFEESAQAAMRRFLAILERSWAYLDQSGLGAAGRRSEAINRQPELRKIGANVCESPRRPIVGGDEMASVLAVDYKKVLAWVNRVGQDKELLVIDPMAMIDFTRVGDRSPEWQGQQEFIKCLVGAADFTKTHIILVCHLEKKGGKGTQILTQSDVQGAAAITRFCQNVILLNRHEEMVSDIRCSSEAPEHSVHHRYTIFIEKNRNGPGAGSRLAYEFGATPEFEEFGIIKPRAQS